MNGKHWGVSTHDVTGCATTVFLFPPAASIARVRRKLESWRNSLGEW